MIAAGIDLNVSVDAEVSAKIAPLDLERALWRHRTGDYGDVDATTKGRNRKAIQNGSSVRSEYRDAKGIKFSITTLPDHKTTTVSLVETN